VEDTAEKDALRRQARAVFVRTSLFAAVATAVVWLLP
jgi:hypothetical protein